MTDKSLSQVLVIQGDEIKSRVDFAEGEPVVQFREPCSTCGNTLHFLKGEEWVCGECDYMASLAEGEARS